jgi:biotin carboxyl carrier protein
MGKTYEIEIRSANEIVIGDQAIRIDLRSIAGKPVYSLLLDGKSYEAYIAPGEDGLEVLLQGRLYQVSVEDERQRRLRQSSGPILLPRGDYPLKAPMPGLVVAVPVSEGTAVSKGQNLVILESMKMQNELRAPRDGIVNRIRVGPGDHVEQNQVLLILG